MHFELSDDLRAFRDLARDFAAKHIAPHARKWDESKWIPDDVVRQMGEIGLLGVTIPEEYGGAGQGLLAMTVVVEEIARHCGATALLVAAHAGLCCGHLRLAANDTQKRKYLPSLATGKMVGSWCLSEPHCGTDAAALTTRAEKASGGWVLNGQKMWVTNGKRAGVFVVMARTKNEPGARSISAFIVERGAKGLEIGEPEDKMGMRGSDTVPLSLEDVRVGDDALVGNLDEGYIDALKVLDRGRVTIGSLSVGLGRGCLEEAVKYAAERKSFGVPLHMHQAIQLKLADMETQVEAARLLVRQAACTFDAGRPDKQAASIAKLFASEGASRVAWESIQIHGGAGYTKDICVERLARDTKLCEIGEGSSEVQRMLIARAEYQKRSA
ncbi:MAG: acyl-CoA dehydrogenase family protein [Phycisphaerae bacterium]|nr:acyl-CoA dehydrogenase family protein [Phycisphaerae bacterium]